MALKVESVVDGGVHAEKPLEGDGCELPVPRERRYRDLTSADVTI
jgi:hypothetical protein